MGERGVNWRERALQAEGLARALADRVYWWSRDQEQPEDAALLVLAKHARWKPWHERPAALAPAQEAPNDGS